MYASKAEDNDSGLGFRVWALGLGSIEIVQGLGANKFCAKVLGLGFFWNHILNLGLGAGLGCQRQIPTLRLQNP